LKCVFVVDLKFCLCLSVGMLLEWDSRGENEVRKRKKEKCKSVTVKDSVLHRGERVRKIQGERLRKRRTERETGKQTDKETRITYGQTDQKADRQID
jgi:hypothetical protein